MSPCTRDTLALQSLPGASHAKAQLFSQCECVDLHLHVLQLSVLLRLPSPSKSFISTSISVLPSMGTIPFVSNLYLSGTMRAGLRDCLCLSNEKVEPNYSKVDENYSNRKKLGGVWLSGCQNQHLLVFYNILWELWGKSISNSGWGKSLRWSLLLIVSPLIEWKALSDWWRTFLLTYKKRTLTSVTCDTEWSPRRAGSQALRVGERAKKVQQRAQCLLVCQ